MQIITIDNETHYEIALAEINRLMNSSRNTDEEDYFLRLLDVVEIYESEHYAIPDPDPIDFLLYFMESRGLTEQDLVVYIGRSQWVPELLNRQRPLTLTMIRKLHQGLRISADILVQPYTLKIAA